MAIIKRLGPDKAATDDLLNVGVRRPPLPMKRRAVGQEAGALGSVISKLFGWVGIRKSEDN